MSGLGAHTDSEAPGRDGSGRDQRYQTCFGGLEGIKNDKAFLVRQVHLHKGM